MTNNTLSDYNTILDTLKDLTVEASDDERAMLENAIESIQRAETIIIEEKREAIDSLYESGDVTEEEYDDYVDYLNESMIEVESEMLPFTETAGIGVSLTLSESEKTAYASKRCEHLMFMEDGEELNDADTRFLESRLDKYLKLCEESMASDKVADDIDEGYMTESIRELLRVGNQVWNEQYLDSERAAKEYIMESITTHGSSDYITEHVQDALDMQYITKPIADRMNRMISICDIKSTMG